MPKDLFVFKPFTIYQPYKDVMKVSTDSVLLGCFADCSESKFALDIGCGTGLLSLMLAHKNPLQKIIAIDINENACACARYNVLNSAFSNQIEVIHISIQEFEKITTQKFDLIISNPPYFSRSLSSPYFEKNIYRHQVELSYDKLLHSINSLLESNGIFYVLIPYYEKNYFLSLLAPNNLFVHSELSVFSKTDKKLPYIFIYKIAKCASPKIQHYQLYIYNHQNKYTDEYVQFTKEYYLYM